MPSLHSSVGDGSGGVLLLLLLLLVMLVVVLVAVESPPVGPCPGVAVGPVVDSVLVGFASAKHSMLMRVWLR